MICRAIKADSFRVGEYFSFSLTAPVVVAGALAALVIVCAIVARRGIDLPVSSRILGALGLVAWCLTIGGATWRRPLPGRVAVIVDLSASTRTATYRNRGQLESRVRELLGGADSRFYYFASQSTTSAPGDQRLGDLPGDRTVFAPPEDAPAVLLFSDGQFDLPAHAQPTYVVVDPGLEEPKDAAIRRLEIHDGQAVAEISNHGERRVLSFIGTQRSALDVAPAGDSTFAHPIESVATSISAALAPGDAWPENDQLSILPTPRNLREQWWVSRQSAGANWRSMPPSQLPEDPAAYLAPAIIVLDNVAAFDLNARQQQRLDQYVREMGGTLLILGGDHCFAAGAYPGSTLESLSPLASTPPRPLEHWIILADSSGSMATMEGDYSRWQYITDSIAKLIPRLPPDDLLSVGSFAKDLNWWSQGKTVRQTLAIPLPPAGVFPHGPTNLQQALSALAQEPAGDVPRPLLLLTDADVQIDDLDALADQLKAHHVQLHLLAIGNGSGLATLLKIVRVTGGTSVSQFDPRKWVAGAQELLQSATPKLLENQPISVQFSGDFAAMGRKTVSPWNRTWLKSNATPVATGTGTSEAPSLGAMWHLGQGEVAALAFGADESVLQPVISKLARPPADPNFKVTWTNGPRLLLKIEAFDSHQYINNAHLEFEETSSLEGGPTAAPIAIPQTAPGQYELSVEAPRQPLIATVRNNAEVLSRIAVAGRYPPEFDAIGNNHQNMTRLAERTGGQVILPSQRSPIDFRWRRKTVSIDSILAALGAVLIGLALVRWRIG